MWVYLMLHGESIQTLAFEQVHFWNFNQSVCERSHITKNDDETTRNLCLIIKTAYQTLFPYDHYLKWLYNQPLKFRMRNLYDKVTSLCWNYLCWNLFLLLGFWKYSKRTHLYSCFCRNCRCSGWFLILFRSILEM